MSAEVERATTTIAKRIAKRLHGSDSMWEMYLYDAYQEYYKLGNSRVAGRPPVHSLGKPVSTKRKAR